MAVTIVPSRVWGTPVDPEQIGGTFVFSGKQADMQKRNGHPVKEFNGPNGFTPYTEILPRGVTLEEYQKRWPDGETKGAVTDDSRLRIESPKIAPKIAP